MKAGITTTHGMDLPSLIKSKIWLGLALLFFTVNAQAQSTPEGDIIFEGENGTLNGNTSGSITSFATDGNDAPDVIVDNFGDGSVDLSYTVTAADAGYYVFNYRIASKNGGGTRAQVSTDDGVSFSDHEEISFAGTGGWQEYTTVYGVETLELVDGDDIVIRIDRGAGTTLGAFNFNWLGLTEVACPSTALTSFIDDGSGSVETETIDLAIDEGNDVDLTPTAADGGAGTWSWTGPNGFTATTQDITISDVTFTELGTYTVTYTNLACAAVSTMYVDLSISFTSEYVQAEDYIAEGDINDDTGAVGTESATDIGGGLNASNLGANDWMEYSVDIPTTGSYIIEYRIANNSTGNADASYTLSDGSGDLETLTFPNTGGWQNYETFSTGVPIAFTAGTAQTWRITMNADAPRTNFNWFRVIEYTGNFVTWDGGTSTDWHTATNWDGDVLPISTDDVYIPVETNEPVITSAVEINSINVASSATLIVSSGTTDIAGDVTANGSFVVESGASLITYDGSTVGDVTINRNTTFSDGKYSFVGSPIAYGAVGSDLGSYVYSYDETQLYSAVGGDRWVDASADDLVPGIGYTQAGQEVISFTGMPNSGDITVAGLTHGSGTDTEEGWALLSNPYAAAINVVSFLTGNGDLDNAIYLWDDGGSDTGAATDADYITANSIGTVAGPNTGSSFEGYIGSMQGFFVKVTDVSGADVTFTESMRVDDDNTDASFFRQTNNNEALNIKLSISSENGLYNEMLVGLRSDATLGKDRIYDAAKLSGNDNLQFYSLIEDSKYAIQGLPLESGVSTELAFDLSEAANLKLSIVEMTGVEKGMTFYITDKETGLVYDLNEIDAIDFSGIAGTDQNRFSLSYNNVNSVLDIDSSSIQPTYRYLNNELTVKFADSIEIDEVVVYGLSGQVLLKDSSKSIGNELKISIENKGINIVKIRTSQNVTYTQKFKF